jgi:hypothetical protein
MPPLTCWPVPPEVVMLKLAGSPPPPVVVYPKVSSPPDVFLTIVIVLCGMTALAAS